VRPAGTAGAAIAPSRANPNEPTRRPARTTSRAWGRMRLRNTERTQAARIPSRSGIPLDRRWPVCRHKGLAPPTRRERLPNEPERHGLARVPTSGAVALARSAGTTAWLRQRDAKDYQTNPNGAGLLALRHLARLRSRALPASTAWLPERPTKDTKRTRMARVPSVLMVHAGRARPAASRTRGATPVARPGLWRRSPACRARQPVVGFACSWGGVRGARATRGGEGCLRVTRAAADASRSGGASRAARIPGRASAAGEKRKRGAFVEKAPRPGREERFNQQSLKGSS
jgi:hypothetical protein